MKKSNVQKCRVTDGDWEVSTSWVDWYSNFVPCACIFEYIRYTVDLGGKENIQYFKRSNSHCPASIGRLPNGSPAHPGSGVRFATWFSGELLVSTDSEPDNLYKHTADWIRIYDSRYNAGQPNTHVYDLLSPDRFPPPLPVSRLLYVSSH